MIDYVREFNNNYLRRKSMKEVVEQFPELKKNNKCDVWDYTVILSAKNHTATSRVKVIFKFHSPSY